MVLGANLTFLLEKKNGAKSFVTSASAGLFLFQDVLLLQDDLGVRGLAGRVVEDALERRNL